MAANPIPNAMISERMAYLLQVDVAKRKAHSKTNGTEKTLSLADGASPFRKACSAALFYLRLAEYHPPRKMPAGLT